VRICYLATIVNLLYDVLLRNRRNRDGVKNELKGKEKSGERIQREKRIGERKKRERRKK
jgi:hypothetical protein